MEKALENDISWQISMLGSAKTTCIDQLQSHRFFVIIVFYIYYVPFPDSNDANLWRLFCRSMASTESPLESLLLTLLNSSTPVQDRTQADLQPFINRYSFTAEFPIWARILSSEKIRIQSRPLKTPVPYPGIYCFWFNSYFWYVRCAGVFRICIYSKRKSTQYLC